MKKIMLFIEGTTFRTKPPLFLFSKLGYEPIGNAVSIINDLRKRGNMIYLCSYVRKNRYRFISSVMDSFGVKYDELLCRAKGQRYSELVEAVHPDILIEDDCKSIGGEKEWCITNVSAELKSCITSIIVAEFGGIDGAVEEIYDLL